MTLSPGSETNGDSAAPPAAGPTMTPPAERKSRRQPRREGPPIFAGDPLSDDSAPPQPMTEEPRAEVPFASESPAAGEAKGKRRGRGASSPTPSISDRRQIKGAIAAGVQLVGVQLHEQAAARDELAGQEGLWLADEQDAEGIAEPLSSIVARRGGPGMVNPDLGDAIAAAIALAVYLSKNLHIRARIRAFRRGQAADVAAEMQQESAPAA